MPSQPIRIRTITAIRYQGIADCDILTMCFQIFAEGEFDLEKAIRDAARDFVTNTADGCEMWSDNNEDFDWSDFWTNVPNEICEKHGFSKMESVIEEASVNWDESLVDEGDIEINTDKFNATLDYLCEDPDNLTDFLEYMELDDMDIDANTERSELEQLMHEDAEPCGLVKFYWEFVATKD